MLNGKRNFFLFIFGLVIFVRGFFMAADQARATTCSCFIYCIEELGSETHLFKSEKVFFKNVNQGDCVPSTLEDAFNQYVQRLKDNICAKEVGLLVRVRKELTRCSIMPVDFMGPSFFRGIIGTKVSFTVKIKSVDSGDPVTKAGCDTCENNEDMDYIWDAGAGELTIMWDTKKEKTAGEKTITVWAVTGSGKRFTYNSFINLDPPNCIRLNETECQSNVNCLYAQGNCYGRKDPRSCPKLPKRLCGTDKGNKVCKWNAKTAKCNTPLQAGLSGQYEYNEPRAFPPCGIDGSCDNLNDLLSQQLGWANFAMSLVGLLGIISFVAGGIIMITSFGNPERFRLGRQFLVAAVIGLIIAFSAYLAVKFILDALGVRGDFRAL